MKRLLKGGRVIDPANGIDGVHDVLIEDGRIARVGRDLPVDGATVVEIPAGLVVCPGSDRHARAPARAGTGTQGDGRDRRRLCGRRWIYGGGVHAEHVAGQRQRERHVADSGQSRRSESRARLPDRRGVERIEGRVARRHRRAEAGRLRGDHRRRAPGGDGAAAATRARIRRDVRHAGHRALRGSDAQRRRRRARGLPRRVARSARHSRRGRGARRRAGRAARRS